MIATSRLAATRGTVSELGVGGLVKPYQEHAAGFRMLPGDPGRAVHGHRRG